MSETLYVERFNTPTGRMFVLTDDLKRLRAVDWEDHEERTRHLLGRQCRDPTIHWRDARRVSTAKRALQAYFKGDLTAIEDVAAGAPGTEFQQQVWAELRQIPTGLTISYGTLAARIGRPSAVRAVGMANGANPIAIIVPCHRVIGANATLVGYGGGLDRKRWLLAHERAGEPLLA